MGTGGDLVMSLIAGAAGKPLRDLLGGRCRFRFDPSAPGRSELIKSFGKLPGALAVDGPARARWEALPGPAERMGEFRGPATSAWRMERGGGVGAQKKQAHRIIAELP